MKKTSLTFITLIVIYFSSIAILNDSQSLAQDKPYRNPIKLTNQKTKDSALPDTGLENQSKRSRRSFESSPRDVDGLFH